MKAIPVIMIHESEMKVYRSSSKIKEFKMKMRENKASGLGLERPSLIGVCLLLVVASLVQCISATDHEALQAPVFIEQPSASSSIVVQGRTKFLQCKAKAVPHAQYKWIKDGEPISDYKDAVFYKISNAARNDSGSYQCLANNPAGTIFSEKSEVIVAYMGEFKSMREETLHIRSGHRVVLNLTDIDSVPVPSVIWETKSGPIKNGIKHFVTSKNQLVILSVDEEDHETAYRARATNTQIGKEEISAYTYLNITGDAYSEIGPEIVIPLENQKAAKNKLIEFECIANARPLYEIEIQWYKDDIPIENTDIVFTLESWNRTLVLLSVDATYKGDYECRVRMKTGGYNVVSSKATLTVLEAPSFKTSAQVEMVAEYSSKLEIPCDVSGYPEPYVTWFRNADAIDLSMNVYKKKIDNTLVIEKIGLDDSGVFQCLASNEAGEKSSYAWIKVKKNKANEKLNVETFPITTNRQKFAKKFIRDKRLAQPRIILGDFSSSSNELTVQNSSSPIMEVYPQNITSLDGKDVTFTCQALGAPLPNVTWIFDDSITLEPSSRYQIFNNGDLVISNIQESDTGSYKCVRSNEAGSVSGEAFLGVLVRTHITKPPSDATVLLGLTASLQCKVSSDQNVNYTVQWFREKQSNPITSNQRILIKEDGTLEISAVRASDVGQYVCMVSSFAGNETRAAKLSVVELPFAPSNVQAKRLSEPNQRTVSISWTAGFDGNSPILKYIVQRREVSEIEISGPLPDNLQNWITELSNISANQKSVNIKNLKAATSYQFRVSAVNRVGEGYPSEPTNTISLPHESPSGPPVSFMGSARSSSEIIAQWQPPLEEHRNGQILGYVLRYKLSGYKESPWTYTNISNEAQRNYLIQDLITWKDYIVQIAAYNNMGTGVYTEGARIKTKEGIPEAPPSDVKVNVINSTAVLVTWKPPNPQQINGINQGYKIQAVTFSSEENGEKETEMLKVPPNLVNPLEEQNCTLSKLRKFTSYNITVLCFTHPGEGVPSQPIQITTQEDVPGEVSTLQFIGVSDRELTMKWSEPAEKNGIITGYQVKYKMKDSSDTKAVNLTAHETQLHVTQLKALTHYWFEVVGWTSKGAGQPKTALIQSGIEPVLPEPPTTLALSNIEAFSVVIQFDPGFDGNSSITKWIVEGRTARNDIWSKIYDVSDPDASTLTVTGLSPYTQYTLRIIARNIVGESVPSETTKDFQTLQAKPKHAPYNVTVRAMSSSELRVRWIPLQQTEWFGNPKGYNITYKLKEESPTTLNEPVYVTIEDPTANSFVLKGLEEWSLYEILVTACNEVGQSVESPSALERTREAVPSAGPTNVEANATSSTTIVVKWSEIPKKAQNGQIEGYKVFYGAPGGMGTVPVLQKTIPNNKTFTTTLTELKKFVIYHIQVLAYTRLGDGSLSMPPVRTQTHEDTPGIPSNVSFPDVSFTTARIIWDVPEESNGEILAYKVTYSLNESNKLDFSREFSPLDRTYRASNLLPEQFYRFTVTAQTKVGWGAQTANVLVFTTNNRELPQEPSVPQISRSQIQSQQITFNWTPGRDGFGPLRYYTVQLRENEGNWITLPERIDPNSNAYTALNLKPYTLYQFRIRAINDLGASPFSKESVDVRTLPAAPAFPVTGLKVVPITTSSVRVEWSPLKKNLWNGDSDGESGYRVVYQPIDDFGSKILTDVPKLDVMGIDQKGAILKDLTQDQNYEIVVFPFNSQGLGPPSSPPIAVYVGEAVPTGEPQDFEGAAVSSTEVRLKWKAPSHAAQNGDLLGYKIFYLITDSPQPFEDGYKLEEETEVVPASYSSHSLVFLDKYTEYQIQILAFNPAGDGPRSRKITIRTLQGLPSAPLNLTFADITHNSLKVSWNPPKFRNGDVVGYIVTYETTEDNEKFSKQVKQKVTSTDLIIHNLEEEVAYTFTVRSQTTDYGPPAIGNITTGPQDGSPISPKDLTLSKNVAFIDLHWLNGPSGKGPILGYYFESKKRDDTKWQVVAKSINGPIQDFTVSFQTLLPSTVYTFRVSSYNRFGISYPIYSDEPVLTPSKLYLEYGYLQQTPFYRKPWFSMSVACVGTIIIIMVTAVLCVKSKSYKYKQEAQKTLEESMAMSIDERQELALELYRSRHGLSSTTALNPTGTIGRNKNGATNKKGGSSSATLGKSPPRPSPASVAYHSDEESLKCYDENPDDSSVTEKPSEVSSSESQQSESENESVRSDGTSFVNHYANINNTLRQSWKRQKPMRNYSSYTDSEPEGSTQINLNGGQIIMNNMARSRAPLPGFSSFV